MRNLLIGAVSAVALIAGSALAADYQSGGALQSPGAGGGAVIVAPGTSGSTNWSDTSSVPSGTSGMAPDTTIQPNTMEQRRTRAINPGLANPNSALEAQRSTGTHCPPGTPNCRPGTLGGQ
jgi:opacity protein-like surface antigen